MARGRPKTLPPSRFVGVLVPISMLDKVEDVRREGQKQCSAYSFSEAIRDVLAKGLEVTWKPVQHNVEPAPSVEQKKEYSFEEALDTYRGAVRNTVKLRPKGQHWTTAIKEAANTLDVCYWDALDLYHGCTDPKHIADMRLVLGYENKVKQKRSFNNEMYELRKNVRLMVSERPEHQSEGEAMQKIAKDFNLWYIDVAYLYRGKSSNSEHLSRMREWYDKR